MTMRSSRHARRAQRRLKRGSGPAQIILTSLIDIFTVLLFFLLIQAANVEQLPEPRLLKLPESTAQHKTARTPVVMVNREEILLDGERVATTPEALQDTGEIIPTLVSALAAGKQDKPVAETAPDAPQITIMGDKAIPYRLLRKVMATCTKAGYSRIALAVQRQQRPVVVKP